MSNPYLQLGAAATGGKKPLAPAGLTYRDRRTGEPANLPAFGGLTRAGTKQRSREMVFDRQGEINAYDQRDVLFQIKHVIDSMAEGEVDAVPTWDRTASAGINVTAAEEEGMIREALANPRGEAFEILGQQLVNPVKETLDYDGFSRRILPVRLVRQGETVRYDKDVFATAFDVGVDAQTPETRLGGRYVFPVPRVVSAYPTINLADVYQAGYDILSRIQDRARQAIEKQEDSILRSRLDAAATAVNDLVFFATANLATMEAIRYQVEKNRLVADKFLVNRREISDFVTVMSQEVDNVTQRELVMAGFIGMILSVPVIVSAGRRPNDFEVIRPGEIFCVTAPEYLGGFPVWVELFSEPTNQFQAGKPVRGWFWWELIDELIITKAGVSKGLKTT